MNNNEFSKKFGAFIASKRNELGLSQEQFSFRSGMHRTYIGMIERGERNITLINVVKLAHALNMTLSEMFNEYEQYR